MEGLVKSAPVINPTSTVANNTTQPIAMFNEVPMFLIEYYGLDPRNIDDRQKKVLNETYDYFAGKPIEDIWRTLRGVELKSGIGNEPRYEKVWRWVKLTKQINNLQEKRDSVYGY